MSFLSFVVAVLTAVSLFSSPVRADDQVDLVEQGKVSFGMYCARCHGPEGKGDGMDAKRLPVAPRNLTEGVYKFRTTESGTPPTDADLLWVLNHGMSGAGMPSFGTLNNDVKAGLVAYIKHLAPNFSQYPPSPVPAPNEHAKVDLKKGQEVFKLLQCEKCHGVEGRANGTSALTLKDHWQQPIRPANLTQGWTYRAGSSPKDIYYRLMSGWEPMPSYNGAVPNDDAWQLANYVASLQEKTNWALSLETKKVSSELPTTVDDAQWKDAVKTDINLQSNYYSSSKRHPTSVNSVMVQTLTNGKEIAFKLAWNDPTLSDKSPVDSFILAFKTKEFSGKVLDNLYTLYSPGASSLDLLLWSAESPKVVKETNSNLDTALRGGAKIGKEYKAEGQYRDGLWTLVFIKPIEKEEEIIVGFAALDGYHDELKPMHSSSKWFSIVSGENKAHH